jgi:hypothetical protein
MRNKERIPIFLQLVDFDKLERRWETDISQSLRGIIFTKEVREYWEANYDQRFGQMLINLGYLPENYRIWGDEEDWILKAQGIPEREFMLWGRNFDKDMNKLPKTEWILIKDMSTDHIQAIIDGEWVKKGNPYYDAFQKELELRKLN